MDFNRHRRTGVSELKTIRIVEEPCVLHPPRGRPAPLPPKAEGRPVYASQER